MLTFAQKKKEGEELPAYELPDNFEEILGLSDNINKREEASIESLLFCENKVLRGEQNRKLFDKKEIKMLEEEREKYVDFLCDKFKGYFPPILEDAGLFSRACKKTKSGKRKKVNSKVDENGEEVDEDGAEDEGENFLTDDNDEGEEDDVSGNSESLTANKFSLFFVEKNHL